MGCKHSSSDNAGLDVESAWLQKHFDPVPLSLFENSAERIIFMAVNLVRNDPLWAIPHIVAL
jgi:hypothetical protein